MKNKIMFILIIFMFVIINSCISPESSFKNAKEKNTIESYTQFIEKYPNHILIIKAKKEIERLKFKKLLESLNIESLVSFIKDNPNSEFIDSAQKQLLIYDYYNGVEIKSELMNYKDFCNFNKKLLQLSFSYTIDGTFTTYGCADMLNKYGHPPILKLSIFNRSGSTKKIELNGFNSLKISTKNNKIRIPVAFGFSSPNPIGGGSSFGFTVIEKGSILYKLLNTDYIDIAFVCPDISKEDIVIFNDKLITIIK